MGRFFGRDVENAIITKLKSTTDGINKILTDIDTERTETYYNESAIKDGNIQPADFTGAVPAAHVFINGFTRANAQVIGEDAQSMSGNYSVSVMIETKISKPSRLNTILNNYEEAITRTLHLAEIGFSWIILTGITKGQIQKADKNYFDYIEAEFTVRIN